MKETSVVIPCYQHGRFLEEAIASAQRQRTPPLEVIVVDDGSTDTETLRVLSRLESGKSNDLRIFRQPNGGPAAARNAGISNARGRFILCLDADDRLADSFLARTEPILREHPEAGIAYGRARYFGSRNGLVPLPPYRFPEVLLDPCIFSTALFRKEDWAEVGGFDTGWKAGWEDYDFWLSVIETGRTVVFVDEVLFDYRQHETSRDRDFSAERFRLLDSFVRLFERHEGLYRANIRILFEAHLERLRWRALFPEKAVPELRFETEPSCPWPCLRAADTVEAGGEDIHTARFDLRDFSNFSRLFRFDPFDGPGMFEFRGLRIYYGPDTGTAGVLSVNREDVRIERHSFGERVNEANPATIRFMGADPFLFLGLPTDFETGGVEAVEIDYGAEFGPAEAGKFFEALSRVENRFRELVDDNGSLAGEVEHLKRELRTEIERRRTAQRTPGYRLGKAVSRLFRR